MTKREFPAGTYGFATRNIHAGEAPDPSAGAHGVPIYQNATYAFRSFATLDGWRTGAPHFLYAREGTPTGRRQLPLVVDNAFRSPALPRPLEQGASMVVHSATKRLSGHGNVLGGTMSAFAAWTLLNGTKTLPLRLREHSANAAGIAPFLAAHPAVAAVHCPGLPTRPQRAIGRRPVGDRCGGMPAFDLAAGEAAVWPFLDALRLPTIAVSLGDVGTLIWPLVGSGTLRLSVGLEDIDDLAADFARALARLASTAAS